ncbi:MAG TPA: SDR family oxidoreductase [Clostridiaceae bacterium]|nr:SDR family oxidoreductase [Clostridiaceae bacterium]
MKKRPPIFNTVEAAVDKLKKEGFEAYPVPFDVTDKKQIEKQVQYIEEHIAPIDILINNAGIQKRVPLEEFDLSDWETLIDVNLTGVFLVSQCVVKGMIQRKAGKIINICSLQSELARPTIAPYAASKGGVKMLTKAMAAEWAKYNIQVNGIAPGYFITDMTKPLAEDEKFDSWIKSRTPAGRWGDVKELIGATIFLASEASSYINGHILFVDGGLSSVV